jgi:heptosyltransferase-2
MPEPARILIRATNWIGDAVMSLPALRAVRHRYPQAHIAVLARPWVEDLYRGESSVDRVIPYAHRPGVHDFGAKWNTTRLLAREKFDLAILFQNAFEAALIAKLSGISKIVGYNRDGRGPLLTESIPVPSPGEIPKHERFYYLELLRRAGIIDEIPQSDEIRLESATVTASAGRATLASMGVPFPVVGISPGAAYGSAKRWLPERFAEAAIQLASEYKASICLFGSSAERSLCDSIVEMIASRAPKLYVRSLAGDTSLRTFIECTAACMLFLTNDSGAMHIASALGVPTVTVFGATDHLATGHTGTRGRVIRNDVPCSPCLRRECPIDHRCMTGVPASAVVDAANELLSVH